MKMYSSDLKEVKVKAPNDKGFAERLAKFAMTSKKPSLLMVHAGPTCGKTFLIDKLELIKGVRVIDTDNIVSEICPEWWEAHKKNEHHSKLEHALLEWVCFLLAAKSADSQVTVLFTNLYGRQFVRNLSNPRLPVSFFRTAEDLKRVWLERGSTGSPDFEKWYKDWFDARFAECKVVLEKDEYLETALDRLSITSLIVEPRSVEKLIQQI